MDLLSLYLLIGALVGFIFYIYDTQDSIIGRRWYHYVGVGLFWPASLMFLLLYAGSPEH